MIEIIMLIERILNEKVGKFNYEIKVNKTTGIGRKKFTRTTMRQTTLDEFTEIDGDARFTHPVTITYSVHPIRIRADSLMSLVDDLVKDLDLYLHKNR